MRVLMTALTQPITLRLPEYVSSPLPKSTMHLQRFTGSSKELDCIYATLSNPKLWEGGYDLSGRLIDITDSKSLKAAIEELWLNESLELMVIQEYDRFVGVTGVMDWNCSESQGWNVLTGRTVISTEYWGSRANIESKLMLYSEIFQLGADQIECTVSCTNTRSLAAVSKFGFQELRKAPKLVDGVVKDFVRFGIPTVQWSEVSSKNVERINLRFSI